MFRFIAVLLLNVVFLTALVFIAADKSWITAKPSFFYQTLFFLFFSTVVIFTYLYKAARPDFFVQLYLLTMALKLIAFSAYVYFMITTDLPGAALNVAFFLLSYFSFTLLEIVFLYRKISAETAS